MKRRKPILEIVILLGACAFLFLPHQGKTPSAEAHLVRGMELALVNRYAEAIEACTRALELEPGLAAALNNRAYYTTKLAAPTEQQLLGALADIDRALALDPGADRFEQSGYRDTRGCVLMKLGRLTEALTELETSVRLNPAQDHRAHLEQCRATLATP